MQKNILVIDDDPLVLKTIKKVLERERYSVEIVKNASDATEKIRNKEFDLLICDVRMPETDGIELIKQVKKIKKDENKLDIPTIFITGYASEETPIKAYDLGAKDYILKPFDIDKLIESVKNNLAYD